MRAWEIVVGVLAGLVVAWLALVLAMVRSGPDAMSWREAGRLLPDVVRLVTRLARDRGLPVGVRVRLGLASAYVLMPLDLVPDFVPVVGAVDDALVVGWTLRSVVRRAGIEAVRRHWPGTDDGFRAVVRVCRLDRPSTGPSWWVDGALVAAFGALTLALANGWFLGWDLAVRDWCATHRPEWAYWLARAANLFGQGSLLVGLAVVVAAVLVWRRRSPRPLLPVLLGGVLTYGLVGPIKMLTHRAPPNNQNGVAYPEQLFSDPMSYSYPSGHTVNAFVWYGVLIVLLAGALSANWRTLLRVAPPILVGTATTYVGFHWFTDTLAAVLLGLAAVRLLWRVCPPAEPAIRP